MNMTETKELLQEIATIDKRQLDIHVVAAWQGILAGIPLEIAKEAHKLARRDEKINYLEPRHIVQWAREAAFRLDRNKPLEEQQTERAPEPTCREHQKKLMSCNICCKRLYEKQDLTDAQLLLWARENIYA